MKRISSKEGQDDSIVSKKANFGSSVDDLQSQFKLQDCSKDEECPDNTIQKLQKEIKFLKNKCSDYEVLKKQNVENKTKIAKLDQHLQDFIDQLQEFKKNFVKTESEKEKLKSEVEFYKKANGKLQLTCDSYCDELKSREFDSDQKLKEQETEIVTLKIELKKKEGDLKSMERKMRKKHETKISYLNTEIKKEQTLSSDLKLKEKELLEMLKEKEIKLNDLTEYKSEFCKYKTEIEELNNILKSDKQKDQCEIFELMKKVQHLEDLLQEISKIKEEQKEILSASNDLSFQSESLNSQPNTKLIKKEISDNKFCCKNCCASLESGYMLDCGHLPFCNNCSMTITIANNPKCPICNNSVVYRLRALIEEAL